MIGSYEILELLETELTDSNSDYLKPSPLIYYGLFTIAISWDKYHDFYYYSWSFRGAFSITSF